MAPFCLQFCQILQEVEELIGLAPEKLLLKWMNFHLKKAGYEKPVTNFSSDLKVSKMFAYLTVFSWFISVIRVVDFL